MTRLRDTDNPEMMTASEPHPEQKEYKLHPTWKRKLRLIMVDNPACMCPYCGHINVYWDDCFNCGREVLPSRTRCVDG